MRVDWLVIRKKHTHKAGRAVVEEPIVNVAGLIWQFDRVDDDSRELMFVIWLVIGSNHTHKAIKAVATKPIVDVAGLVWQFDRIDGARRELICVN